MLLGKVLKLVKRYLPEDNNWCKTMVLAYEKEKVDLYYKIPTLPKNFKLRGREIL